MDNRKRPFNKFEIDGEVTMIFIKRKNGEEFKTIIDTEDLQKIINYNSTVQITWSHTSNSHYSRIYKYQSCINGKVKYKSIYLHRLVTNADKGMHVDHINHNTLDNRKCNLRVIQLKDNNKHRKSKNSNNKSGYRNVFWDKRYKKWVVSLMIEGRRTILGKFDDVHEAGKHAEEMRKRHYGSFAGVS